MVFHYWRGGLEWDVVVNEIIERAEPGPAGFRTYTYGAVWRGER